MKGNIGAYKPLEHQMVKYLCSVVASEIEAVSKVKDDLDSLQHTVSLIQDVLEDAEKQQIRKDSAKRWLKRLKDVAYDADDILDDFSYKVIHAQEMGHRKRDWVRMILSSSNPLFLSYNIANKIDEINRQLGDIAKDKVFLDFQNHPMHLNLRNEESNKENRETTPLVDDLKVIGRAKDKEMIINMLLATSNTSTHSSASSSSSRRTPTNETVSVIPIVEHVGMPEFSILKAGKIENVSEIRRLRLCFDETMPTYPKSLKNASKLRTLISDIQGEDCNIHYQNFFENKQFRVLDLQWSSIKELPPSIGNMKHLRADANECAKDSTVMEQLQPNPSLVILKIVGFMGAKFPTWMISSTISSALPNLVEVELKNCYRCEQLPALGQLPCLKILTISTMDVVQFLGTDFYGESRPSFLSLISFTLHDLPLLRMWEPPSFYTRRFASTSSFPNSLSSVSTSYPRLEKMTVEKCPKLERSHDLTFIRGFFPSLKEYKLDGVMKIRLPYKRYATIS
ncbi:hypothetical protein MKW92_035984 [Papaver armeniacum]|nr:hypothetical protein MKW92_035984 [Papaver armeniacum]